MHNAKPSKCAAITNISIRLLSTAHKALLNTRQTEVAKRLGVADSTILRRTEKYPEIMDTLAACGIHDFVLNGEMKVSLDQYRWLLHVATQFAEHELERTSENPSGAAVP